MIRVVYLELSDAGVYGNHFQLTMCYIQWPIYIQMRRTTKGEHMPFVVYILLLRVVLVAERVSTQAIDHDAFITTEILLDNLLCNIYMSVWMSHIIQLIPDVVKQYTYGTNYYNVCNILMLYSAIMLCPYYVTYICICYIANVTELKLTCIWSNNKTIILSQLYIVYIQYKSRLSS